MTVKLRFRPLIGVIISNDNSDWYAVKYNGFRPLIGVIISNVDEIHKIEN